MTHDRLWIRIATLLAVLLLGACGSAITLKPTTPGASAQVAQTSGVAAVNVTIAPDMPPDRAKLLEKTKTVEQLHQAVLGSFASHGMLKPAGVILNIQIHVYRISNWGPSRLGAQVTITDAAGAVVETFSRESASVRGGSTKSRTQRLAQELVQKIVDES